jgi:cell division transport system permease protein
MTKYPDSIDKITKARLRFSAFGSIFSIALTMFLIGMLVFFAFFSTQYIHNISKKIEMEILFYSEIKEADIMALEQEMKLEPFISSSRVSSRADNTQEAIKTIGNNYTEIITNPINASIIISVNPDYANADSLRVISKRIKQNQSVQDVQYPKFIVQSFYSSYTYQIAITGICVLFMIISMLLIANSIRLNIYAKRFNIRSMLLVGATRGYVRRPFIFKGFVQGVWGGFIALIFLGFVLYQGNLYLPEFIDFSYILYISLILLGIFVFSILFTIFVSVISVNKYIKMKLDRLYL